MSRKGNIKNVINGVLSSFVSRNNDVNGYWGIGKLYSLMLKTKTLIVVIDLLQKEMTPKDDEFNILINEYNNKLTTLLKRRSINLNLINEVNLVLKAYPNQKSPIYGQTAPNRINCELVINYGAKMIVTDDKDVWCRKHNPKLELKSTRNYENKNIRKTL